MKTLSYHSMYDFKSQYNKQEFLEDNTNEACLSIITTPNEVFKLEDKWVLSKQFMFEDTDNVLHPKALTDEMALDIVKYLIKVYQSNVEHLAVHCYAGISRSRAIVLFYQEVLNQKPIPDINRSPFITHNRFVYQKLIKAYQTILDNSYTENIK